MRGVRMVRGAALVFALSTIALLGACRPLFVPLVPATIAPAPRFELSAESRLWWDGPRLRTDLVVAEVPSAGWMAVQWRDPSGAAVASDSVWVSEDGAGRRFTLVAPVDVVPSASGARWHATVSFGSDLVRQLSTADPDATPGPAPAP